MPSFLVVANWTSLFQRKIKADMQWCKWGSLWEIVYPLLAFLLRGCVTFLTVWLCGQTTWQIHDLSFCVSFPFGFVWWAWAGETVRQWDLTSVAWQDYDHKIRDGQHLLLCRKEPLTCLGSSSVWPVTNLQPYSTWYWPVPLYSYCPFGFISR